MQKEDYIKLLESLDDYILVEIDSWGSCTVVMDVGISDEPGGDTELITGPFCFSATAFEDAGAVNDCPDGWNYEEWEEAVLMKKHECQPDQQYFKFLRDGDWDTPEYSPDRRLVFTILRGAIRAPWIIVLLLVIIILAMMIALGKPLLIDSPIEVPLPISATLAMVGIILVVLLKKLPIVLIKSLWRPYLQIIIRNWEWPIRYLRRP